MANPLPALMCVNYKGNGNVQVFPLLNGVTLDAQDGSDVLVGNLETNPSDYNNQGNRLIEAFGKRYLLHGFRVYERDSGGVGNWGEVTGLGLSINDPDHSGLHVLNPAGVVTLGFLCEISNQMRLISTTDGVNWTNTNTGLTVNAIASMGASVVFRDSIFWFMQGSTIASRVKSYDLVLSSATAYSPTGASSVGHSAGVLHVHQNTLFLISPVVSGKPALYRLDGTSFIKLVEFNAAGGNVANADTLFSDGNDLISFFTNDNTNTCSATRFSDVLPGGSVSDVNITTPVLSAFGSSNIGGYFSFVSTDPDPLTAEQRIYFWYRNGGNNSGTFDLFRFNYRQIGHGAETAAPFVLGEVVTQSVTGAFGTVTEVGAGFLALTDVGGPAAFNASDTLTGEVSTNTAPATSLLLEQAVTSLGIGILASNFGIPVTTTGGLDRIPTIGNARPAFGGQFFEIPGGLRRRTFQVFGTGADVDLALFFSPNSEAPDQRGTISAVSIANTPVTTGLVGDLGEVALEALSPATGDAYVVLEVDGDSSLTPGALAIAVGDIVEFDGANWTFVHDTATSGFPDFGTHATLSTTTALISPYTDGVDDGVIVAFDGTGLKGILLSVPSLVSNEVQGVTPSNGTTTYNLDHDSNADDLFSGDRLSIMLDIV